MFTDTVTIYHKLCTGEYEIVPVEGVQWSDKTEKRNENGKISVVNYIQITFPEGTYENLILNAENTEDCIVFGKNIEYIVDEKGSRISDLMKRYPKSGLIQSVNDNSNRDFGKNIKVILSK